VLFVSKVMGPSPLVQMQNAIVLNFLGVNFAFTVPMVYGSAMMLIGTIVIVVGWLTLYRDVKKNDLVTTGIYSFSRRPQYLGFLLVITGWMIGWPTVMALIFGSILIIMYVRVCFKEKGELMNDHDYSLYRENVPFML